jgi:hypothetical protein
MMTTFNSLFPMAMGLLCVGCVITLIGLYRFRGVAEREAFTRQRLGRRAADGVPGQPPRRSSPVSVTMGRRCVF